MNKKYISERYWEDKTTPMGKVDMLAKQYKDVIDLSLGDPDINTHESIIENAFEDARNGHTGYTDFRGDAELREEIKQYYLQRFSMPIEDKEIFITASACIAMFLALEAILNDGEEVIMQAPYFTPYKQQIELARGVPIELPTYEEDDFQINIKRLERLITPKTKALIINTPNNPTGHCLSLKTMRKIAEAAERNDILVIADDIYTIMSYQYPFIPFASIGNARERTITINSFSKDFAMTGWRVGNIIAPETIINTIQLINENVMFTAPSISQRAALHALRNRDLIQPEIIARFKERVSYAAKQVNLIPKMNVRFPPKGTFYLYINIKETGLSSEKVSEIILKEAHVLSMPGIACGECGEGYIRIACVVEQNILQEALNRIKKVSIFN